MSGAYTTPGEHASRARIALTALVSIASASGALVVASPWLTSRADAAGPATGQVATDPPRAGESDADAPAAAAPVAATVASAPAPTAIAPAVSAPVVAASAPACAPRVALVFPYASAAIPEAAAELLAPIVAHASEHVDATVLVDGHADPSGTELDNLVLSKRRANGIARLLDRAGIAKQRLVVRAFGAYVPMPGEGAELRRVHVSFADDPCRKESP